MDENCSELPNTEVGSSSPSSKPRLDFSEVGKLSPNDRAESPDTNCAICLGKLQNKSFTDSCLHQFCFTCLLEWSKVKAECPLCKQSFKSIIHNVRSIEDYDQYHLRPATEPRLGLESLSFLDVETPSQRSFRYRTTMVPPLYGFLHRLEHVVANRVDHLIPPGCAIIPSRTYHWHSNGNRLDIILGTSNDRRNIYRQGLWVRRIPDVTGRFRECSPEFFANNPAQIHRLVPWLNRELNVLLSGTGHSSEYVITRILDLIQHYPIRSWEFRNQIQRYFGHRTEHFIHEFYSFGTSPYDMIGYDRHSIYGPPNSVPPDETENDTDSSDSDVQIVDVVRPSEASPSGSNEVQREGSPVAGPSSARSPEACIAITSGSDTDSEECMVVGSVKPRHLRTPEIITLDDDEDDIENPNPNNETEDNNNDMYERISSEEECKPFANESTLKIRIHSSDSYKDSLSRNNPYINEFVKRTNRLLSTANGLDSLSSSDNSSEEEWGRSTAVTRPKKRCTKDKKKRSSSKKKAKESKKKKSSKEKKSSKPLKHWKKKLFRLSSSSSSSSNNNSGSDDYSEPRRPHLKRRRISSSSSSSSSSQLKDGRSYINPFGSKRLRLVSTSSSRIRSVVHVRNERQESNDSYSLSSSSRGRSYDRDNCWPSTSSSSLRTVATASAPASSSSSSSYGASSSHYHYHINLQGRSSTAVADTTDLPRRRLSTDSSSSSTSVSSPESLYHQRKSKHKRTRSSKRKHS